MLPEFGVFLNTLLLYVQMFSLFQTLKKLVNSVIFKNYKLLINSLQCF